MLHQKQIFKKRREDRRDEKNQYICVAKANFRQLDLRFSGKSIANNQIAQNKKVFLVHFND